MSTASGSSKKSYSQVDKKSENVAPEINSVNVETAYEALKEGKLQTFAAVCHFKLGMLCLTVGS